jgi:protein-S-isoprenylcysteine O-methyltransferase Ste14
MWTPERAVNVAWLVWLVSWWAAAAWRRPAVGRAHPAGEILHLSITLLGFAMVFTTPTAARWASTTAGTGEVGLLRLWRATGVGGWALFGLAVAGFAFCWWARLHLGALWSGSITRRADHRIIQSGPYGLVRHPIYTGLILAAAATAALRATAISLAGVALVVLGLWIKARLEERFLRAELGAADYDSYARRVPMLFPRPWRR